MGPSLEPGPFYPEDRTSSGHTPGDLDAEAGALKGAADSTCHPPAEDAVPPSKQILSLANSWRGRKQIKSTQFKRRSIDFFFPPT